MSKSYILILSFIFLPVFLIAQENILVELADFYPEKIEKAGFTLNSAQDISIEASAIAPYHSRRSRPFTDTWILKSDTREVVWELADAEEADRSRAFMMFKDQINLEAGDYEVYYSTFTNYEYMYGGWNDRDDGFWGNMFGNIFYGGDSDIKHQDYRKLNIIIKGAGIAVNEDGVNAWHDALKAKAFLSYSELRDDSYEEKVMIINQPVSLKIYALGEAREDGAYDFGWIIDTKTREKVWELNYRRSHHAGGARKNRVSENTIQLNPGTYKLLFATDDSHSYRRWNSAPPFDPSFWGVTLWLENEADKKAITFIEAAEFEEQNVIVKFDRVRDSEYRVQGFSLNKPLTVNIYALGEGSDGDMYDYGWLMNAKTRTKVWEMDYYDTDHAGGARKNRIFDGSITLEPGNYMAYYVTDGSHSYRRWNSGKPFNESKWGMTISVIDDNYQEGDITAYNEEDDESILVRITRVGDHDRARAQFELDKGQEIHIYAIGEGSGNEMYDYAWIEDINTGRVVWEMTYRKTERAGGARKNRLFDGNIFLESGEYEVFYESDDSHSFADWNDSPPHDPVNWGVTITRIED